MTTFIKSSTGTYAVCIYCVLETMRRYGGDFVKILTQLWWHADAFNRQKVQEAFAGYFVEYAMIFDSNKTRCRHEET